MKVMIKHDFPTLNEYTSANRANVYKGNQMKKEATNIVAWHFSGKKIQTPCKVKFIWHLKNNRRDYDNVAFAKKFILDGMQQACAIPNDNAKHVVGFIDEFVKSDFWGCEVEILETEEIL